MGSSVDAVVYPDGAVDQLTRRILVHIVEALEVQVATAGLVRARPRQHRPVLVSAPADQVDGQVLATR
jgi:hypothetical protein